MREVRDAGAAERRASHIARTDGEIVDLAARQHAMVSTAQLHALGLGKNGIDRRLRAGFMQRYLRAVYLVGPFLPRLGPEMAALLACPGSVLAEQSSAFAYGVAPRPPEVHLISPTNRRSRPGLVVHRAKLAPAEIWEGHGLTLTSPFRTLSDLRHTPVFAKAVWEASYQRLITDTEAQQLLGHAPPTADHDGERVLEDLVRQSGLPPPKTNVRIGRWEIDLYWPEHRVAVAVDDPKGHGHGLAQHRDERKDQDLERRGIALLRVPGEDLSERPLEALATIAVALAPAA